MITTKTTTTATMKSASLLFFWIFAFSLCLLVNLTTACPAGWLEFNKEKCVKYLAVNVHFSEAEQMCKSHNSSMIAIHSYEEQEFILGLGRQHYTLSGVHWIWLGAHRNSSDSKDFYWRDGSVFNFSNWRDGCPDNRQYENCVLMTVFRDRPSHWCNFKCESNYDHVVCQKEYTNESSSSSSSFSSSSAAQPFSPSLRPQARFAIRTIAPFRRIDGWRSPITRRPFVSLEADECDIGWDFKNNKCYKFISDNVTGEEARYFCKRYGDSAQALTIMSEAEQTWAVDFAFYKNEAKDAIWIGATRVGPELLNITWRDGRAMNYTNWAPHEPDNRNNSENCVAMNDMAKFFGRWLDAPCSLKFHLICEKKSKIPIIEPNLNATSWNELFAAKPDSRVQDDPSIDPDVKQEAPVAAATAGSTSVPFLIFLVVLLGASVAFLGSVVFMQRKQLKNNLRESRVNIYYASSGSAYEPEYEEAKYDNVSHAYATTTASLIDEPIRAARV